MGSYTLSIEYLPIGSFSRGLTDPDSPGGASKLPGEPDFKGFAHTSLIIRNESGKVVAEVQGHPFFRESRGQPRRYGSLGTGLLDGYAGNQYFTHLTQGVLNFGPPEFYLEGVLFPDRRSELTHFGEGTGKFHPDNNIAGVVEIGMGELSEPEYQQFLGVANAIIDKTHAARIGYDPVGFWGRSRNSNSFTFTVLEELNRIRAEDGLRPLIPNSHFEVAVGGRTVERADGTIVVVEPPRIVDFRVSTPGAGTHLADAEPAPGFPAVWGQAAEPAVMPFDRGIRTWSLPAIRDQITGPAPLNVPLPPRRPEDLHRRPPFHVSPPTGRPVPPLLPEPGGLLPRPLPRPEGLLPPLPGPGGFLPPPPGPESFLPPLPGPESFLPPLPPQPRGFLPPLPGPGGFLPPPLPEPRGLLPLLAEHGGLLPPLPEPRGLLPPLPEPRGLLPPPPEPGGLLPPLPEPRGLLPLLAEHGGLLPPLPEPRGLLPLLAEPGGLLPPLPEPRGLLPLLAEPGGLLPPPPEPGGFLQPPLRPEGSHRPPPSTVSPPIGRRARPYPRRRKR